jgi:hypothetical protein
MGTSSIVPTASVAKMADANTPKSDTNIQVK